MRTAFLTPSISRAGGGVSEICRRLAQSLAQINNLHVDVIGLRDRFTEDDRGLWRPLLPKVFGTCGPTPYGYAPGLSRALIENKSDVVHVHGIWMYVSLAAARWARSKGQPYVITIHGMLQPWALNNSRWKKRLARWLVEDRVLRGAACVHVNTLDEARNIRRLGINTPICVIANGVDVPAHLSKQQPAWAPEIGGCKTLLYLGRIHPKKGLRNLFHAFARLPQADNPGWKLIVAGWDQDGHEQELRNLARDLGIDDLILFVGPQFSEAKAAALAHADAFILPSHSEGLPMAVLEAWAHRCPVLMTPQCNLTEGFDTGCALRIEPDSNSILGGLKKLFAMTVSQRKELADRARNLVEERFTWSKAATDLNDVYRWLVAGAPCPQHVLASL